NFNSPFHGPFPGIDTLTPSQTFLATSPSSNNTLTTPHAPPVSRSTRASTPLTTPYALRYFLNAAALVKGERFENNNAFGGGGGKLDACPNGPPRTESYSVSSPSLPGTRTHAPSSNTSPFTLTNTSLSLSLPLSFSLPFPPRTLRASSGRPASATRTASMR
ncbi:hypothetical protein BDZ89DRAFT_1085585, partial [Hymenopellis radicata]